MLWTVVSHAGPICLVKAVMCMYVVVDISCKYNYEQLVGCIWEPSQLWVCKGAAR